MESIAQVLDRYQGLDNVLASLLLLIGVLLLRQVLMSWVRRSAIHSSDLRRRWVVQIRNGCFLLLVLGLVFVWASELRTFALSLAAFIVAFVLSTKELISCLTGSFLKISSRAFSVGDRIEVGGLRGDVIDQTLLVTRIMEVGPAPHAHLYTGKTIALPNSLFLTAPIVNFSLTSEYVLHSFCVPLPESAHWQAAEEAMQRACAEVCAPFVDDARRALSRQTSLDELGITVEPTTSLVVRDEGKIDLAVRVPLPGEQVGQCEQGILRRFFALRAAAGTESD
jgi:small-conductance mechanosensitive channel